MASLYQHIQPLWSPPNNHINHVLDKAKELIDLTELLNINVVDKIPHPNYDVRRQISLSSIHPFIQLRVVIGL